MYAVRYRIQDRIQQMRRINRLKVRCSSSCLSLEQLGVRGKYHITNSTRTGGCLSACSYQDRLSGES